MQLLANIQDSANAFAHTISRVLGVDVEIVDNRLRRVAGTGRFRDEAGRGMGPASRVYTHVLETGSPVIVHDPGNDEVCRTCPQWGCCDETFEMSTPILHGSQSIGVIGFVCFTEEQRTHILANFEKFFDFLLQMGQLLSAKAVEVSELEKNRSMGLLLGSIIDKVDEGVLVLDEKGYIVRSNRSARLILGLEEHHKPELISLTQSANRVLGRYEYELFVNGRQHLVMGEKHSLEGLDHSQLLIFRDAGAMEAEAVHLTAAQDRVGLDTLIGDSWAMQELKAQIRRVADSPSTVLILGDSGVGKELVARALYEEHGGMEGLFVAVNCGAIPETLLESELFGHVRGAFTGANPRGRMGKFEQAHNGVLFLDEIGDMPLHLQAKLLRALEQKEITRLGAQKPISVNVRVIAATNRNLEHMVAEGMFREDLFYRLNVIPIRIPPLRERPEDLRLLTAVFLERYLERLGKNLVKIDDSFWTAVYSYHWPGNVRELQNALEYAAIMMDSPGILHSELLPTSVKTRAAGQHDDLNLERTEVVYIQRALRECKSAGSGRKTKELAAARLGIGVATLYRKIKKYGLE